MYLLTSCLRSERVCASELALPLTAPQLSMLLAMFSSYILLRMASSFCFRMRRRVLCLTSLMRYSAIVCYSALGSYLYFLYLRSALSYSYSNSSSPSWPSSSWTTCRMFCCSSYSWTTCFSLSKSSASSSLTSFKSCSFASDGLTSNGTTTGSIFDSSLLSYVATACLKLVIVLANEPLYFWSFPKLLWESARRWMRCSCPKPCTISLRLY